MRKLAILLALLVVAGAGGFFGLRAYADRQADQQITALFTELEAGGVKAEKKSVGYDLFTKTLDLGGLDFSSAAGRTTVGRVVATGVEQPSPDRVKATRIEITDLVVDSTMNPAEGRTTTRIPTLIVENYDGPARIDTNGADPLILLRDFLTSAAAARISLPEATVTRQAGTGEQTTTTELHYGATVLTGIGNGVVATAVTEPSRFSIKVPVDTQPSSATGEFGRISGEKIDIVMSLLPLVQPAGPADAFRTAYGRVTIDSYRFAFDNGFALESGPTLLTDVAIRPVGGLVAELVKLSARTDEARLAGGQPDKDDLRRMTQISAQLVDSVRIGGFELTSLKGGIKDQGTIAIGAFRLGAFDVGRLSSVALESVEGTQPATPETADEPAKPARSFKLGRFALTGLRLADLIRLGESVTFEPAGVDAFETRLASLRLLEGVEVSGVEAPGPRADDAPFKLDTFKLAWGPFLGALPTKFAGTLRIDAPLSQFEDQDFAETLGILGATRFTAAIDIGGAWNEADKTVTLAPLSAEVAQAFSSSAKVTITNVGREAFADKPEDAFAAAVQATFGSVEFTLADLGLYDLKVAQVAEDQGATPQAVRELFTGIAQLIVSQVTEEHPDLAPAGKAVLDFLAAPKGKLSVSLKPKEPLPLLGALLAVESEPTSLLDVVTIEATSSR